MNQTEALKTLKSGKNVFLTGIAGSGKTFTLINYINWLRDQGIKVAITASTGIAATHIHGRTIHSFTGIGIRKIVTEKDLKVIAKNERLIKDIASIHVLIIDEISMLSGEYLNLVDQVLRYFRGSFDPFGGVQVVFCGDFLQLPPVEGSFAFTSQSWKDADPVVCYLDKPYRQTKGKLIKALNAIRSGNITDEVREIIKSRINAKIDQKGIVLFTHNEDIDIYNKRELDKVQGKPYLYLMQSMGVDSLVQNLKKNCLSPETLELKVGAQVMVTKNMFEEHLVNGSMAEVVKCDKFDVTIKTSNGRTVTLEPQEWSILGEGGNKIAMIQQIPLRLAYAITVHKSQGMTLDYVVTDLSRVFQAGQGYVALSRLKEIENLTIKGEIPDQVFVVDEECLKFESEIKTKP